MFNRVNGRRPPASSTSLEGPQEPYTLAHEENVRFVSEGRGRGGTSPLTYTHMAPCPSPVASSAPCSRLRSRVGAGAGVGADSAHCPPTAWQQVEEQLGAGSAAESGLKPVQYVERTPNPRLQGESPSQP